MRKTTLFALLGVSLLPSSSNYCRDPNSIYEEFIDYNLDRYVEIYIISTPKYPEKTRVLISREFADYICGISNQGEDTIRINYNSKFTSGLELVRPQIMDKRTQSATNERNKLAVSTNGLIITR
ncbi:MAG: hypothetical protein ACP5N7_04985 [Candidatus Pacearchaeota archaeon]